MSERARTAGADKIVFQGRIIEVVNRPVIENGQERMYELARRAPGVRVIIPVDGGILLTKEFRHEHGDTDYRLPGGKVFDSLDEYNHFLDSGEDIMPIATKKAKAEAKEEAGAVVDSLTHFATSHCGATVDWDLHYFVAGSASVEEQALEAGEEIEPIVVSVDGARAMALDGRMSEERSALILLRYLESISRDS